MVSCNPGTLLCGTKTSGDTQAQNHLVPIGTEVALGLTQLGIIFNPSQPNPNSPVTTITLNGQDMQVYNNTGEIAAGLVVGTDYVSLICPICAAPNTGTLALPLNTDGAGTGNSGLLFGLDAIESTTFLASLNAGTIQANDLIGLSAT